MFVRLKVRKQATETCKVYGKAARMRRVSLCRRGVMACPCNRAQLACSVVW